MIAARRRYDAGTFRLRAAKPVQVHESAPDLECPSRCVIFVFHPHAAPGALLKLRPRVLRRRRHHPMHEGRSTLQFSHVERGAVEIHDEFISRCTRPDQLCFNICRPARVRPTRHRAPTRRRWPAPAATERRRRPDRLPIRRKLALKFHSLHRPAHLGRARNKRALPALAPSAISRMPRSPRHGSSVSTRLRPLTSRMAAATSVRPTSSTA